MEVNGISRQRGADRGGMTECKHILTIGFRGLDPGAGRSADEEEQRTVDGAVA